MAFPARGFFSFEKWGVEDRVLLSPLRKSPD